MKVRLKYLKEIKIEKIRKRGFLSNKVADVTNQNPNLKKKKKEKERTRAGSESVTLP